MESCHVKDLGDSLEFKAEGIYFDNFRASYSHDIELTRCYVNALYEFGGLQATNCVIKNNSNNSDLSGTADHQNIYINCILNAIGSYSLLPYDAICNNCIMVGVQASSNYPYQYKNCVVIKKGTGGMTILNGAVNNSVIIGLTIGNNPASFGNVVMSISDVFENWDGSSLPTDLETYVLKSSVSNSILGLDGTEVGIFGGFMPFDWRPSYSIIKRFNVANRTTADGKLSVDIEVISE